MSNAPHPFSQNTKKAALVLMHIGLVNEFVQDFVRQEFRPLLLTSISFANLPFVDIHILSIFVIAEK